MIYWYQPFFSQLGFLPLRCRSLRLLQPGYSSCYSFITLNYVLLYNYQVVKTTLEKGQAVGYQKEAQVSLMFVSLSFCCSCWWHCVLDTWVHLQHLTTTVIIYHYRELTSQENSRKCRTFLFAADRLVTLHYFNEFFNWRVLATSNNIWFAHNVSRLIILHPVHY